MTKSFSEQKGMIGNNPLITQDFMADPTAVEYDVRLYVLVQQIKWKRIQKVM